MSVAVALGVALAGGCGAVCRYLIDYALSRRLGRTVAWGTWLVNLTGALALGVLIGAGLARDVSPTLTLILGGGFLGAYTTFSTWMLETLQHLEQGAWRPAVVNVVGPLITGIAAAALGMQAARWLFS